MTKTKLRRFEKAIEKATSAFRAEIEKLAESARVEILRAMAAVYRKGHGNAAKRTDRHVLRSRP